MGVGDQVAGRDERPGNSPTIDLLRVKGTLNVPLPIIFVPSGALGLGPKGEGQGRDSGQAEPCS